jgi:hypothetical protein
MQFRVRNLKDKRTIGNALELKCLRCGAEYPLAKMFEDCPKCKTEKVIANLTVTYENNKIGLTLKRENLESRNYHA